MKKEARLSPAAIKKIMEIVGGAGVGGAAGYYATPYMFGYEDVPAARRTSAFVDALIGAGAGATGFKNIGKMLRKNPMAAAKGGGILAAGETVPITQAFLHKARESAQEQADAARIQAKSSIPFALENVLKSDTAKGVGMGAGAAGLAALLTGLSRRKSEEEMRKRKSRMGMVGTDMLKYMLPAMVAGGVIGSLKQPTQQ